MYKKILFGTCLTEYCGSIFNFAFNLASEILKLARNAGIGLIVMGPSDTVPIAAGESINARPLGPVISETAIGAPCPVLIIPQSLIAGLASG